MENIKNIFSGRSKKYQTTMLVLSFFVVSIIYLGMANDTFYFLQGGSAGDVMLAKAMSEGDGFYEVWRVGQPPCTVRPPGLAFLISLIFRVFGINLLIVKVVNNIFGIAAFGFGYLLIKRMSGKFYLALTCAFFAAVLPFWAGMLKYIYSGYAYSMLLMAGLLIFMLAEKEEYKSMRLNFLVCLVTALIFFVRSIGIVLPAAAIVSVLFNSNISASRRIKFGAVVIRNPLTIFNFFSSFSLRTTLDSVITPV